MDTGTETKVEESELKGTSASTSEKQEAVRVEDTRPVDALITNRDIRSRNISAIAFVLSVILISLGLGYTLGTLWFDSGLGTKLTTVFFFAAGILFAALAMNQWFLIRNDTNTMFVTQNTLKSLAGSTSVKEVNVIYGPGVHTCYPWEKRIASNNISLEEVAQDLEGEIQLPFGKLDIEGSFRLRPNPQDPVNFLNSSAEVASEISDLILAKVLQFLIYDPKETDGDRGKNKRSLTLKDSLDLISDLNSHLKEVFTTGHIEDDVEAKERNNIEQAFGIIISDVTISKLLPEAEVQRTMSAVTEAESIFEGAARLLGYDATSDLNEAKKIGEVTQQQIDKARERFMAVSGNLEGMDIRVNEIELNIGGVEGEVVKDIKELVQSEEGKFLARTAAGLLAGRTQKN